MNFNLHPCDCGTEPKMENYYQWFYVQCPNCKKRTAYYLDKNIAFGEWGGI